jgi:N-acetyl sugar amidotransferase
MIDKFECNRCVLNCNIPALSFDSEGICNYCREYEHLEQALLIDLELRSQKLDDIVEQIKQTGKNKRYDCLIGLSGGVDSSYVAWLVKKLGLRPLAIHLDNGWNSDIAVTNIHNVVRKLEIDLYTHVIDWEEFKDLQISFIRAGVVDIELLTDHAITAIFYKLLKKEGVKYMISGSNIVTEAIMPESWSYAKWDKRNIKAIHNQFGTVPIKTFPMYGFYEKIKNDYTSRTVRILDYIDYNKEDAIQVLKVELDWKSYGGKHHESFFTKFYQLYILPNKFDADKRYAHLSTLINSGQITKEEAKKELEKPLYPSKEAENEDIDYFCKKIGLSRDEFKRIISEPPVPHTHYPNGQKINNFFKRVKKLL